MNQHAPTRHRCCTRCRLVQSAATVCAACGQPDPQDVVASMAWFSQPNARIGFGSRPKVGDPRRDVEAGIIIGVALSAIAAVILVAILLGISAESTVFTAGFVIALAVSMLRRAFCAGRQEKHFACDASSARSGREGGAVRAQRPRATRAGGVLKRAVAP